MFLVGLSPVLKVDLFWLKFSGEKGQKAPILSKPETSLPRRRSSLRQWLVHLGKPKAQFFPVLASPQRSLLRLGEPEIPFLFVSFVNSGNHPLD